MARRCALLLIREHFCPRFVNQPILGQVSSFSVPCMYSSNLSFSRSLSDSKKNVKAGSTQPIKTKGVFGSRPVEKKKRKDVPSRSGHFNVVACATAANYNLNNLRESVIKYGDYIPTELTNDSQNSCIFAVAKNRVYPEDRCIFYFKEGAIVLWNCDDLEQMLILDQLKLFEYQSYNEKVISREMESMYYTNSSGNNRSVVISDVIHLNSSPDQRYLDMYTFSNSMALSVKLGSFESFLEDYIASTEFITDDLKHGKKIRISRREVLRKSGELFSLRHYINLSTDLIDTPDFYWDRDNLLALYQSSCNYFSIALRTKVLNEKLNHCIELIDLVSSHLSDRHHVRLEWMIIVLIMIEIVFEVMHYLHS